MVSMALILLQSAAPSPPARLPILDHQIACELFGPHTKVGKINAHVVAESAALGRLTMHGETPGLPLPPAQASALSEKGLVAAYSGKPGNEFHWMFKLPNVSGSGEGLVTVTAGPGTKQSHYVATGICQVTSSKAAYQ